MTAKPSPRLLRVAAAQLGGNEGTAPRSEILDRMLKLMDDAAAEGVKLLAYPELALTTFFPVFHMTDEAEIAKYFEPASLSDPYAVLSTPHAKPLVDKANALGVDFYLGFAERWTGEDGETKDYNTTIYYSVAAGQGIAKYRKVHLPGTKEPLPDPKAYQQLEKRYFTPGDLGFQAFRAPGLIEGALKAGDVESETDSVGKGDPILGMLICNDRRWPEAWRPYGLQGAELVIEGYNTTAWAPQHDGTPKEQQELAESHHRLSCQAGSYQNALWSINVAKCGEENGQGLIGGSMIIDPNGRVVAESKTMEDELIVATIDLAMCQHQRSRVFNFEKHRRLEHYSIILDQAGLQEIPLLGAIQ
ncbi:carbon-nitrogen hydrolase [Xylariales sp. AK1849]|nr:carbon-nitrogen hydrolase [Xylariales sp. AK1849]